MPAGMACFAILALSVLLGWTFPAYRAFAPATPAADLDETGVRVSLLRMAIWWVLTAQNHPWSTTSPTTPASEIVIDTSRRTLTLLIDGEPVRTYPCAVGRPRTPSPTGEWKIVSKSYNWGGGFGSRWLGLNVPWGIYGIHGTNKDWSIGRSSSAGCIRMFNRDVEDLFRRVTVGTPVRIIGPRPALRLRDNLAAPTAGPEVVELQLRLREIGFAAGWADGRFGPRTVAAVQELQAFYGLPVDGKGDRSVQTITGLR
jgi:hypothetical protein